MRLYETTFIVNPQADDATIDAQVGAITKLITSNGGEIVREERMGTRRLAYEIQGLSQGFYTSIIFNGEGKIPSTLEKYYKLEEPYIRYLTIIYEADPNAPREERDFRPGYQREHGRDDRGDGRREPRRDDRSDGRRESRPERPPVAAKPSTPAPAPAPAKEKDTSKEDDTAEVKTQPPVEETKVESAKVEEKTETTEAPKSAPTEPAAEAPSEKTETASDDDEL